MFFPGRPKRDPNGIRSLFRSCMATRSSQKRLLRQRGARVLFFLKKVIHFLIFSDSEVYITQTSRCSNVVPKLFHSQDSGLTFAEIPGPYDDPAAFVDYRGMEVTPQGLVVNCFVCYPKKGGGCPNATFFTAKLFEHSWTVYALPQIVWNTHCLLEDEIFSMDENQNLIVFDPLLGQIVSTSFVDQKINVLVCTNFAGPLKLLGLGANLYALDVEGNRTSAAQILDFGGRNITNFVIIF